MESVISRIHQLWGASFFWKCSKLNLDFKNAEKNSEKAIYFSDNCIWIGCVNLSLLRREYLSATFNALRKCAKVFHIVMRAFFQLICLDSDQYIWWSWCCSDLNNFWYRLPCCLSKGPLKFDFLEIYLTTLFRVRNFRNKSVMRASFFSKVLSV